MGERGYERVCVREGVSVCVRGWVREGMSEGGMTGCDLKSCPHHERRPRPVPSLHHRCLKHINR